MILSLGTLVLLLFKSTMGSLQQNTVLNGSSIVLRWKFRMPAGKNFFAFKIFEESLERELATITKQSTYIHKTDRLNDRVFNDTTSDFDTDPMVFRLRIGPMTMDDDGLVIMYQVIDTGGAMALTGLDSIKVASIPYYCDSMSTLNEKYSFRSHADLNLTITVCNNPMLTVEWIFPEWTFNGESPQLTTINIIENSKPKLAYNVLLKNVNLQNCGRKVYYNVGNGIIPHSTGETTINITGTPSKIIGLTAETIEGVNKCVRVFFNKVNVGLCKISYQVKFVFPNATEIIFFTTNTTFDYCDVNLLYSTVNVATLFNGIIGPYNDVNVNITKEPPTTTTTTTMAAYSATDQLRIMTASKWNCDCKCNFGMISVVGSFFGGVFLTLLSVCVIHIVKNVCAGNSSDERLHKTDANKNQVDGSNYTPLNAIQSHHSDYAVPSSYTEISEVIPLTQSNYTHCL